MGAEQDNEQLRCHVTKNLCGTDTWQAYHPCSCGPCQKWLCLEITRLQSENERLRKAFDLHLTPQIHVTGVDGALLKELIEAINHYRAALVIPGVGMQEPCIRLDKAIETIGKETDS